MTLLRAAYLALTTCTDEGSVMLDCVTVGLPLFVVVVPLPPEHAERPKSNKPAAMPEQAFETPEIRWNMEASEEGTV